MGSEGPSAVTVHVTGFKKFIGVPENPTEKIVSNLQSYMEKKGLPKNLVLGSCTVLEVAGQGALGTLYEVLESAISNRQEGSQIIWVSAHLSLYLIVCTNIMICEAAFLYLSPEKFCFATLCLCSLDQEVSIKTVLVQLACFLMH